MPSKKRSAFSFEADTPTEVFDLSRRLRRQGDQCAPITLAELETVPDRLLNPDLPAIVLTQYVELGAAIDDRVLITTLDRLGTRVSPAHCKLMLQLAKHGEKTQQDHKSAIQYRRVKEHLQTMAA